MHFCHDSTNIKRHELASSGWNRYCFFALRIPPARLLKQLIKVTSRGAGKHSIKEHIRGKGYRLIICTVYFRELSVYV
jgi:hypothetical protein